MILYTFNIYLDFENYRRGYAPCVFDSTLIWEELCHLEHNTEANKNLIQQHFNCSKKEAEFIMDLPLINVVPGSRFWNGTDQLKHKIGDYKDVTFISDKVIRASTYSIVEYIHHFRNKKILIKIEEWIDCINRLKKIEIEKRNKEYQKIHKDYSELFTIN